MNVTSSKTHGLVISDQPHHRGDQTVQLSQTHCHKHLSHFSIRPKASRVGQAGTLRKSQEVFVPVSLGRLDDLITPKRGVGRNETSFRDSSSYFATAAQLKGEEPLIAGTGQRGRAGSKSSV